jgi:hypothetical protein
LEEEIPTRIRYPWMMARAAVVLSALGLLAWIPEAGAAPGRLTKEIVGLPFGYVDVPLPRQGTFELDSRADGGTFFAHNMHLQSSGAQDHVLVWTGQPWRNKGVTVRLRGAASETRHLEAQQAASGNGYLFVGQAERFAEFNNVFVASAVATNGTSTADPAPTFNVVTGKSVSRLPCLELFTHVVSVVDVGEDVGVPASDCASVGAQIVVVGKDRAGALAAYPPGQFFPWGGGVAAWTETLEAAADLVARETGSPDLAVASQHNNGLMVDVSPLQILQHDSAWTDEKRIANGNAGDLVFVILFLYVGMASGLGIWVSRRWRRPLVTWLWFPALSIVTTVGIGILGWRPGNHGQLHSAEMIIVSPDGAGRSLQIARLVGRRSTVFSLELPWRDAVPMQIDRGHRFGSPWQDAAASLVLNEDKVAGKMQVDGVTVSRNGVVDLAWAMPVQESFARVTSIDGQTLEVENISRRTLTQLSLCTGKRELIVPDLKPGEKQRVSRTAANPSGYSYSNMGCAHVQETAFMLIARASVLGDTAKASPKVPSDHQVQAVVMGPLALASTGVKP